MEPSFGVNVLVGTMLNIGSDKNNWSDILLAPAGGNGFVFNKT